jgi:hypothetical protein
LFGCEAGQIDVGGQIAAAVLTDHGRSDAVPDTAVNRHVSPDRHDGQGEAASGKGHGEKGPQPIRVPTEAG